MACHVAYTTPKESYSKTAAFIPQSKATPDPRKKKQKSNKEQAFKTYNDYVSNLLDSTTPSLTFPVGISPLKENGEGEAVHDSRKEADLLLEQFKSVFAQQDLENLPSFHKPPDVVID